MCILNSMSYNINVILKGYTLSHDQVAQDIQSEMLTKGAQSWHVYSKEEKNMSIYCINILHLLNKKKQLLFVVLFNSIFS